MGTGLETFWGVQIYYPACVALIGADVSQYIAAILLQYMTAYGPLFSGILPYTSGRTVVGYSSCIIVSYISGLDSLIHPVGFPTPFITRTKCCRIIGNFNPALEFREHKV